MSIAKKLLLLALAGLLTVAGIFGIALPLLPTIPLLLAASYLLKKAGLPDTEGAKA